MRSPTSSRDKGLLRVDIKLKFYRSPGWSGSHPPLISAGFRFPASSSRMLFERCPLPPFSKCCSLASRSTMRLARTWVSPATASSLSPCALCVPARSLQHPKCIPQLVTYRAFSTSSTLEFTWAMVRWISPLRTCRSCCS